MIYLEFCVCVCMSSVCVCICCAMVFMEAIFQRCSKEQGGTFNEKYARWNNV